jgi:hypothetical protein
MKDVLDKAGLSVPMIHGLNEFMSSRKETNVYGRTLASVLLNIRRDVAPGTLHIARPGHTGETYGSIGVYGSLSRSFIESKSITVQYGFNAIERCIDNILNGNDSTLYLDERLGHVLDRKLLDIAAHGINITVEERS